MTKLSIITVNLNNAQGLRKTIESVVSQTFADYEYIIIDGGSTDDSIDIIKQYEDKITYWVSEQDKGIYNAMNKGILHAKGDYLIFINSGDYLTSNILSEVFAHNINADIVCGNVKRIFNDGHIVTLKASDTNEISFFQFYKSSPLPHQASFFKRSLFSEEMYNENNKIVSDWEFSMKQIIFKNCSYEHLNIIIAIIEPYGISYGKNPDNVKERDIVIEKYLPKRFIKDYELLCRYNASPLANYILSQKRTTRFEFLITQIVKYLFKLYNVFTSM
jgi:glycosyltransferase involved in cell wall biosynthesis